MHRSLTLLVLGLTACPQPVDCTMEARSSVTVTVTVTTPDGAPAGDAVVTYSVDGAAEAPCETHVVGEYVCAYEVAGDFTIRASLLGYEDAVGTATVEADECHVIGQTLSLQLTPLACTDHIVPAVIATLRGASDEVLDTPTVGWKPAAEDGPVSPCDEQLDGTWACAPEATGDLAIQGTAGGHTVDTQTVTVVSDGCHPIQQNVDLVVDWLPD